MAHDYFKCRRCGTVSRTKEDTSTARLFDMLDRPCANSLCTASATADYTVVTGKSDVNGVLARQLAQKMVNYGPASSLPGLVRINYVVKQKVGPPKFEEITHNGRNIKAALERLVSGKPLPVDVNNRIHFHDGGKYRGGGLPIQGVKDATVYYREYGVLTSSRGWETNLSSERLVVGACSEMYYTSLHYQPGWWWVFSAERGVWSKFDLRA